MASPPDNGSFDPQAVMARAREIADERGTRSGAWKAALDELYPQREPPPRSEASQERVPMSVIVSGSAVLLSVIIVILTVLEGNRAESLSDLSNLAGLTFFLLPLLIVAFLPWFGIALYLYTGKLEAGARRTTLRVVAFVALVPLWLLILSYIIVFLIAAVFF